MKNNLKQLFKTILSSQNMYIMKYMIMHKYGRYELYNPKINN